MLLSERRCLHLCIPSAPLGIVLSEKWHWFVYMAVIIALGAGLIGLFYLPYFRKARREQKV